MRGFAFIMAVTLSVTSCKSYGTMKNVGTSSDEPVTFTFYNADGKEDPWTDPVAQEITKATGVILETDYPVAGNEDKVSLMIATGEYPDIIFAKSDVGLLINNKSLIDLSDLIDQYGPHIKQLYGEKYEQLRYSEEDPSIYQLSCNRVEDEILTTSGTAQLQWAVILANDYKYPKTLDEYETMIKKYMASNPLIDGKKTIGISICCSDWRWYTTLSNPSSYIANGSPDNGQWIVDKDNKVHYKHSVEGQKEFYQWMNRMHAEGILDPEFATQTYEDYLEKIASGRVLGLMDASWDYTEAEQVLCSEGKYDRTYAGLPITMNSDIPCTVLQNQGLILGWGIGITKSCKDPVRVIKFIDWLCTEEAQVLMNWGIEGVNYYYDEKGKRCRTDEEVKHSKEDTNYSEETGVGLHNYPFPSYGSLAIDSTGNPYRSTTKESVIANYNIVERKVLKNWGIDMLIDIFPSVSSLEEPLYTPLWSQAFPIEVTTVQKNLDDIAHKELIECVVCKPEEFEEKWDQFQEKLDETGRQEVEKAVTEIIQKQIAFRQSK